MIWSLGLTVYLLSQILGLKNFSHLADKSYFVWLFSNSYSNLTFFFVFVVDIHSLSCYAKNNYKGAVEAMKGGLFIFNLGIDIFLSIKQLVHVDLRSFVSSKQFVSGFVGSQQNLYTSPWDRTRSSSNISHFQNFCRHCIALLYKLARLVQNPRFLGKVLTEVHIKRGRIEGK